jgi:hypothetical protein
LIKSGDLAINCDNLDIQCWGVFSDRRGRAGDCVGQSGGAPRFTKGNAFCSVNETLTKFARRRNSTAADRTRQSIVRISLTDILTIDWLNPKKLSYSHSKMTPDSQLKGRCASCGPEFIPTDCSQQADHVHERDPTRRRRPFLRRGSHRAQPWHLPAPREPRPLHRGDRLGLGRCDEIPPRAR